MNNCKASNLMRLLVPYVVYLPIYNSIYKERSLVNCLIAFSHANQSISFSVYMHTLHNCEKERNNILIFS